MTLLKCGDLLGAVCAYVIASFVMQSHWTSFSLEQLMAMQLRVSHLAAILVAAAIWHASFASFNLYHSRRLTPHHRELFDVAKATCAGSVLVYVQCLVLPWSALTLKFFVVFWLMATAIALLSRAMLRQLLCFFRRRGRNLRHILIFGTNERALQLAHIFKTRPDYGYNLLGFVDDEWQGSQQPLPAGVQRVADLTSYVSYLRNNVVDEVAICLPMRSQYGTIAAIIHHCAAQQGIIVRLPANLFDSVHKHVQTDLVDEEPIVTVGPSGIYGWALNCKEAFDRLISAAALIVLAPAMLAIAIAIKVSSPGPVLFRQKRLGLNKRPFLVYKFRTMVADAESRLSEVEHLNEQNGPVFKIRNDPRVTPVGRFLRKLSLDELPQFWNVLRGDMSLVGPRPLPLRDYAGMSEDWHRRRFSVRPGISCLWQISGRNDIQFERWMELDLEYIDRWSFWLDLKILARTIPAVLRGQGAS